MTSIAKRPNGRWRARYRDSGGREHARHFTRKADAQKWLDEVTTSKAIGTYIEPARARELVSTVADAWLAGKVKSTPSTAARNRGIVERRIKPKWGAQRVGSVEHGDVQSWVADLVAEGLAPTTVRKIVFVLSGIMKTAVKTRRVASNPCISIELPTAKVTRRRYLTASDVEALARAAGEHGAAVYVLAYCGLRWGEFAALRVRNVDLLRGRLVIDEAVTEVDGALVWGAPKDHQRRTVPVPAFLRPLLEQRIEGKSADDLVFVTTRGAVMRVRGARRAWFDEAAAGLGGLTPHELRHTAASLAVSAGASVLGVQRLLGHEKASMTLDVYADLFDHDLDDVATRLDEVRASGLADYLRTRADPAGLRVV